MYSAAEQFLIDFHAAQPGLTAQAFAAVPVTCDGSAYPSSYDVLAAAVPHAPGRLCVLDLACGDGWLLSRLAARQQAGLELAGIDMSAAELTQAAHRLQGAALLHEGRAQRLPFAAGSFDMVLSHLALMLMEDPPAVLAEIHRVLKPAGLLHAVVGMASPASHAMSTYVELLTRYRSTTAAQAARIGDARWRSEDGLHELLGTRFTGLRLDDIRFTLRLSPAELWQWFLRMYDLHQLPAEARVAFEREYQSAVAAFAGDDGKLDFPQSYRRVQGCAAT